jgi:serine/threonine protein kinase
LHAINVVHNDIKPNNILLSLADNISSIEQLDPACELYLVDFGLSMDISNKGLDGFVSEIETNGNIHFMSMNQLDSQCKIY